MLAAADYDATLARALETGERSIQLDSSDEYAHWNLGNVLVALRHHDRAIAELERAVEINPNHSTAWGSLGNTLSYAGRPSEGITNNEVAIRSDPLNASIFFRYSGLALGHYLTGDEGHRWWRGRTAVSRALHVTKPGMTYIPVPSIMFGAAGWDAARRHDDGQWARR